MKTRGFTLIELLAVIVVLAIIALIATPIVMNVIKDAKEESNKRSVEMYAKALELSIAKYQMQNNDIPMGKYTTTDGKNLIKEGEIDPSLTVDYNGEVLVDDVIINYDGTYYISSSFKDSDGKIYTYGIDKTYKNGQVVYFDVTTGKSCTNYHEDNSITNYNGDISTKTTDNQNGCLKFYAFNDDYGKTISLLLDHNTTAKVSWNQSERWWSDPMTNENGPSLADGQLLAELKKDTELWVGTITPQDYNYNNGQYTIDYSGYKARLIEANEVARLVGNETFDEASTTNQAFWFKDYKLTGANCAYQTDEGCDYGWLYDRKHTTCEDYGCFNNGDSMANGNGYWTSSADLLREDTAWTVLRDGRMGNYGGETGQFIIYERYGVRPVIEVLKSSLQINNK